jgi:RNA-directed DNA polymerase
VRREIGEEQKVKVLYGEGVANHTSPESCVLGREAGIEALTGEHVGWVLSRERINRDADAVLTAEGHTRGRDSASASSVPRGPRPQHACMRLVREPGDLRVGRHQRSASGRQ